MRQLTAYRWPGNIRELQNFLARAVILSTGEVLDASIDPGGSFTSEADPPLSLEEAERRHIEAVLKSTRWVVEGPQGAAATLQMNASTLRSMMKRLGIQRPSWRL
jgi:formate hydrogenlyase transcriptional activator